MMELLTTAIKIIEMHNNEKNGGKSYELQKITCILQEHIEKTLQQMELKAMKEQERERGHKELYSIWDKIKQMKINTIRIENKKTNSITEQKIYEKKMYKSLAVKSHNWGCAITIYLDRTMQSRKWIWWSGAKDCIVSDGEICFENKEEIIVLTRTG